MSSKESWMLKRLMERIDGLDISQESKTSLNEQVEELVREIVESTDFGIRNEYSSIYSCGTKYLKDVDGKSFGEGFWTKELRRNIGLACFREALARLHWVRKNLYEVFNARKTKETIRV